MKRATVIEVARSGNESDLSFIRRFSKKVQESGVLMRVRKLRFNEREESKAKRKKSALRNITRRKELEKLRKLGKLPKMQKKGWRR